jgi:hypothetical protein
MATGEASSEAKSRSPAATPALPAPAKTGGLRLAVFEVVWIFLIFFLAACSPPPDAGESHYFVKAKHYWNPAWCAGDLFLESPDTHWGFYWTFGWLTQFCSLEATTWIVRVVVWGLLAWSWRRLSWAVVPLPLYSLLSAGLMLLFARHCHWAKELVLRGGVEGKTVAYVLVFLALEAIVRNRWRAALLHSGAAGTFHVLVGGWTAIAIGLAWLASGRERPRLLPLLPAAIGGLVLALPGLIPALALLRGGDPLVSAEAARVYAFERLPHHLVFHRFNPALIASHAALLIVWAVLFWRQRREATLRRLQLVVAGAVAIALIGVLLDQAFVLRAEWLDQTLVAYQRSAAPGLRYYWFRVEDVLVPVSVSLAMTWTLSRLQSARPRLWNWLVLVAIAAAGLNLADIGYWRARYGVPGSVIQQRATPDLRVQWWWEQPDSKTITAPERYALWKAACAWIAENLPRNARFLTPRYQQTFKWHAGRAEVATRKDIPQDAPGIVAWKRALRELYPSDSAHVRRDLLAFSDEQLVSLAHKYDCQFIVIDRTRGSRPVGLVRVYPVISEENPAFAVYRVPAKPTTQPAAP